MMEQGRPLHPHRAGFLPLATSGPQIKGRLRVFPSPRLGLEVRVGHENFHQLTPEVYSSGAFLVSLTAEGASTAWNQKERFWPLGQLGRCAGPRSECGAPPPPQSLTSLPSSRHHSSQPCPLRALRESCSVGAARRSCLDGGLSRQRRGLGLQWYSRRGRAPASEQ